MAKSGVSTDSLGAEKAAVYTGKKLRIALIGCGGISPLHLDNFAKMPEVQLVAGCDIKPERLEAFTKATGVQSVYADWKEMLKNEKVDAVDVCTPNGLHAPAVIDALNSGLHAITEKPMAMSPKECQAMIDAARKNKKKLCVGFQYRFHPNTQILARARDEGQFGDIKFIKCQALRRRGIPNWGVFGQKALQGGGPMIDIGVHVIEMAHYFLGSPKPVAATGNTWTYMGNKASTVASQWPNWDYQTYTVEDLAIGHIRFENGTIMQIEASFAAHIEKDVWNFTAIGDKGGCAWDPCGIYTDRAGTMWNSAPAFMGAGDFPSLFKYKLQNFVDACLKDTPLLAPGEAGIAVQKIIDGVYRSAEAGKEVAID